MESFINIFTRLVGFVQSSFEKMKNSFLRSFSTLIVIVLFIVKIVIK